MNERVSLINDMITLELTMAHVYLLFARLLPAGSMLFEQLAQEEHRHANLLHMLRDRCPEGLCVPDEVVPRGLHVIKDYIERIQVQLIAFQEAPPDMNTALKYVLSLEEGIGESHMQMAMKQTPVSETLKLMQQLNADDKDHAQRILCFMRQQSL